MLNTYELKRNVAFNDYNLDVLNTKDIIANIIIKYEDFVNLSIFTLKNLDTSNSYLHSFNEFLLEAIKKKRNLSSEILQYFPTITKPELRKSHSKTPPFRGSFYVKSKSLYKSIENLISLTLISIDFLTQLMVLEDVASDNRLVDKIRNYIIFHKQTIVVLKGYLRVSEENGLLPQE